MKSLLAVALSTALLAAGCGALPTARTTVRATAPVAAHALAPAKFFANAATQAQAPMAFAQQPAALGAIKAMAATAEKEHQALIAGIRAEAGLQAEIDHFAQMSWEGRLAVLKRVQAIECRVMGITPPKLVIGEGAQREAYFDFDPTRPGTGTVILYPEGLAREADPYAALLLLVHETRHSAQFQMAFQRKDALAKGYKAAFEAQKALEGKLSFCDFCSLLNEHEAFQHANFVVGALTGGKADTSGMGCLSSQYDAHGKPIIDLVALAEQHGPAGVLAAFNRLEQPQFEAFGGAPAKR